MIGVDVERYITRGFIDAEKTAITTGCQTPGHPFAGSCTIDDLIDANVFVDGCRGRSGCYLRCVVV